MLGALLIFGVFFFGSFQGLLGFLRGHSIAVMYSQNLGDISAEIEHQQTITLKNLTASPVTISGGHSSCTCAALSRELPFTIDPWGSIDFQIILRPAAELIDKPFTYDAEFYVDGVEIQPLHFEGHIIR